MTVDPSLRYATFPDLATAQSLSKQAWDAIKNVTPGGDVDAVTIYNFPVIGLTDGRYAIVIHSGSIYQGETLTVNGRTFALTAGQIASLATRAGMNTLLGDVIPIAVMASRISAQKVTAINTYANAHPAFKTSWTQLQSGPVDLQADLVWTVLAEVVGAGVITQTDADAMTVPVATAEVS